MKSARSSVALIKKDSEVPSYAQIFEAEYDIKFSFTTARKKGPAFVE